MAVFAPLALISDWFNGLLTFVLVDQSDSMKRLYHHFIENHDTQLEVSHQKIGNSLYQPTHKVMGALVV